MRRRRGGLAAPDEQDRNRRAAHVRRYVECDGAIWFDIGDGQLERWIPALFLSDRHRKLDRTNGLIIRKGHVNRHIAENAVIKMRLDAID